MEVNEDCCEVTYELRVPHFSMYKVQHNAPQFDAPHYDAARLGAAASQLTQHKTLNVGSFRASLAITLDLFDRKVVAKNPADVELMSKNVRFKPQPSPSKFSSGSSSPFKSSDSTVKSPRFKKSVLKELYTFGGIEEVIYATDDADSPSKMGRLCSPRERKQLQCVASDVGDPYNVGIKVTCTHTSAPWQLLRYLQVRWYFV